MYGTIIGQARYGRLIEPAPIGGRLTLNMPPHGRGCLHRHRRVSRCRFDNST
jgi:hypothetical protein